TSEDLALTVNPLPVLGTVANQRACAGVRTDQEPDGGDFEASFSVTPAIHNYTYQWTQVTPASGGAPALSVENVPNS
ncbi:MAG: hypothetical protein CRN43_11490, partial [Candidatus Nephrothrix sp. EaCA]